MPKPKGLKTAPAISWSRGLLQGAARSAGGAAMAGIGYKLGADLYEAVKRWLLSPPTVIEDEPDDDEPDIV